MDTFFNRWPWKYRALQPITHLCKMFCRSHDDQRAGSCLKQRISSDRQCGLCSRNCERRRCVRRSFLHIVQFFKPVYHCSFLKNCFYRSTGIVAGMSSSSFVVFCYWSTVIVAGLGFPTFVADHGCVSSPPNMMIHMALD